MPTKLTFTNGLAITTEKNSERLRSEIREAQSKKRPALVEVDNGQFVNARHISLIESWTRG